MAKGKRKNPTNRNQDHSPSSERSTPTPPSPGHPNTTENLDPDLKTFLMMMIEDIKKDFHKSFMRMITETLEKGNLIVKSVSNSSTKDKDGKTVGNITTTNTMNTNELIIRYNSEIEKIKKQKIKCIESLLKTENTFKGTDCN